MEFQPLFFSPSYIILKEKKVSKLSLINTGDNILHYFYELKEFFILYENEYVKLPNERLMSISIINNYIENLFPVFRIVLDIDTSTYFKILKNKSTVKFKIRMQKFYRKGVNHTKVSLYDDYLSKTFSLILDDDDNDLEEEIRKKAYGEDELNQLFAKKNQIEFFLFDSELLNSFKKTINVIIDNGTVTNAISLIASRVGLTNLLMSPSDNIKTYDQLIIPPMKLSAALAYIDTFYGLYEKGSLIYFGVEAGYILKYDGPCTAYHYNENQTTSILVPKPSGELSDNPGVLLKQNQSNQVFNICPYNSISFRDDTVSKDLLEGKEVRIIDLYTGEVLDTLEDDEKGRRRIITNRGENEYFVSIYKSQMNSSETVISCAFEDIDLSTMTPNKRFNFIFEDIRLSRKYRGTYILTQCNILFTRQSNEFKAVTQCIFRKSGE